MHSVILATLMGLTLVSAGSSSLGTQLARVLQETSSVASPGDVCVLHGNQRRGGDSGLWIDLVSSFARRVSEHCFVLVQSREHLHVARRCEFYLIYLNFFVVDLDALILEMLRADAWNRFAKFIFVSNLQSSEEKEIAWSVYASFVHSLGVTKSVHISLIREDSEDLKEEIVHYNLFTRELSGIGEVHSLVEILLKDYLCNVEGYQFTYVATPYPPYSFIEGRTIKGPHLRVMQVFTEYINATLRVSLVANPNKIAGQLFYSTAASVLCNIQYESIVTEIFITHDHSGYCLIIPERLIGSFFTNLLKPFRSELWVFISILLVALALVVQKFPRIFPRSLFSQVFFGSSTNTFKTNRLERFTLFALSLLLFLLGEAYLAKMLQFMISNKYKPRVNTLAEFFTTQGTIYSNSPIASKLAVTLYPQLSPRLVVRTDLTDFTYGHAMFFPCSFATTYVNSDSNLDPQSNLLRYYVLPEPILTMLRGHTFSRRQPFVQKFRQVFDRLQEGGFLDHWIRKYVKTITRKPQYEASMFDLDDLGSLWWILAYGFGVCVVVFAGEISITKIKM